MDKVKSTFPFLSKLLLAPVLILLAIVIYRSFAPNPVKLYWFIPDGVRAEPYLFNIYEWAENGELPNIKKLMDMGTYGYSRPTFPSHTPTNFASLLTGTYPEIHGVDDGPMHVEGKPLDKVAIAGFRSSAKKVDPIWKTLEEQGEKVAVLSIPGSTPPEINEGLVLRGRWGGWGADFHAINFETKGDLEQRVLQGRGSRLFFFGPELTQYIDPAPAEGWENPPASYSEALEVPLTAWGETIYAYMFDSTDDGEENYDRVTFSTDKKIYFATLEPGVQNWSDWTNVTLKWASEEGSVDVNTQAKVAVIKLEDDGFYRFRIFYNNLNEFITFPGSAAEKMIVDIGPMVDFVDNFPPQLIYYPEDKGIFLDEANMSLDWHKNAVSSLIDNFSPSVIIHDTYTPNQMLTSRWWMGYIDPTSARYDKVSEEEREQLWDEVKDMYKRLDAIIGEILNESGKNTYIVLSSDHGAVPLDRWVHLNNYFAQKGWLKFTINPQTGEPIIDWENSSVIYLKMTHVYINPNGLDGNYERASGEEYEALRDQVISALEALSDENGEKPVVDVVKWENAKDFMQLDPERVGDLVIANTPGYGWNEEMTKDLNVFSEPLKTGYKQAIRSETTPGMWTPFIIAGPNVKEGNFLGNNPVEMIDQYPTIMTALGKTIPDFVQGEILPIFKK